MAREWTGIGSPSANPNATGTVTIKGDTGGLVSETSKARDAMRALAGDTSKQAEAMKVATAATSRFTQSAKQMAPSLTGIAVAAAQGGVNVGNLAQAALSAANAFGPWGVAVGVVATALFTLADSQDEAAIAAKRHNEAMAAQRREIDQLRKEAELASEWVERLRGQKIADNTVLRGLRETESFLEEEAARAGKDREKQSEIATARAKARAEIMREEGRQLNAIGNAAEGNLRLWEAEKVLREDNLRILREENSEEEKRTGHLVKQLDALKEGAKILELRRMDRGLSADVDRQLQEQRAATDESSASRFGGELIDPFSRENELELARQTFEQANQARHEAELARAEEIKRAEESRIESIERTAQIGQEAASMAVMGILDVADARRDATRAARLQGATEREAARAGQIATAMAIESQLKSLRNMAALHAIEYAAKGIASQASTYGFPNPQSIGYFTAAGVMAGIAVASGGAALAVGSVGDSMQMGGGRSSGFGGAGFGPGSGDTRPRSGPSPVDSEVPGSPTPQPRQSGGAANGGGVHLHLHGQVFGVPQKQFWLEADKALGELSHERKRAS